MTAAPLQAHPVDLLPALRHLPYPLLLDSAATHPHLGRVSYLTADPFLVLEAWGDVVRLRWRDGPVEEGRDPWGTLQRLLRRYAMAPAADTAGAPPFQGGAAGYVAYDAGRLLERLPARARAEPAVPDMALGFYDWVLAHDVASGRSVVVATGLPEGTAEAAQRRTAQVVAWLGASLAGSHGTFQAGRVTSNFPREAYLAAVRRVKEYLAAGDVYQVNLSQRLEAAFEGDPWALYRRLRAVNPAPFAAYLEYPDLVVLSASPERFLRVRDGYVETRPIKGTRPRGGTPDEDARLARELAASEKDRAENVMIVDLLRNDLGRVCRVGSVRVPALFQVEAHPTVWHLVSTVTGHLPEGKDAVDLLRASFPGGSITGAPKVRAMEIIEELEPVRRGVYCGSIGYISFSGAMDTSIAIRTMVVTGGRVYLQVGGGIVADSEPEAEHQETMDKARGMLRALGRDG